jgi:hypothetical protein
VGRGSSAHGNVYGEGESCPFVAPFKPSFVSFLFPHALPYVLCCFGGLEGGLSASAGMCKE